MVHLQEVRVGVQPLDRFSALVGADILSEVLAKGHGIRDRLSKRVLWNVNSTAVGGGVAEMLPALLGYTRSLGIDSRWMVIEGSPAFFGVTKRIHHALHGSKGDGAELGCEAREIYESQLQENAVELASLVRPRDIVILHDPQTAGLAPMMLQAGARVIWRCHIGADSPNDEAQRGWEFLEPYTRDIPVYVFSRQTYVPPICDHGKSVIIQPSIDAFSPKNQEMCEPAQRTILVHTGIVEGPVPTDADPRFLRDDGTPGRVERRADMLSLGRAPAWDTPLVVQVSRWDPLKDMGGVMEGFARFCRLSCRVRPELVLAGPNVTGVADDPESAQVYNDVVTRWRQLPHAIRDRVHLVSLPTADSQENAAIVNALQRHASVIVQKSLQEGFGLTVTEGMWKARPVIASAVGGIQDQIEDRISGLLLKDPTDLDDFAGTLRDLLSDPERVEAMGEAARQRVQERFLGLGHLLKYADLIERIDQD
jgi:trehalose synthase